MVMIFKMSFYMFAVFSFMCKSRKEWIFKSKNWPDELIFMENNSGFFRGDGNTLNDIDAGENIRHFESMGTLMSPKMLPAEDRRRHCKLIEMLSCLDSFHVVGWEHAGPAGPLHSAIHPAFINRLGIHYSISIFEGHFVCIGSHIVIHGTEDFLFMGVKTRKI